MSPCVPVARAATCTPRPGGYAFYDVARFVCYYEQDGNLEARDYYRQLAAADRDARTLDLAAVRDGCQYRVDYPEIARRAERYFA